MEIQNKIYTEQFKATFAELLKCNIYDKDIMAEANVATEMELYISSLVNYTNYEQVTNKMDWCDTRNVYPQIQLQHQHVVDAVKELKPMKICEIGAGAGAVVKNIYPHIQPGAEITCLEWGNIHIEQMKENFTPNGFTCPLGIEVKANIVKAISQNIPFPDNSFDLVYSCTVMMHIPYIPAILTACEIARTSSKYVLHIENKNDGFDWFNSAVIMGKTQARANRYGIDYPKLYSMLGYKTIKYFEFPDPNVENCTYIYFLAEKI